MTKSSEKILHRTLGILYWVQVPNNKDTTWHQADMTGLKCVVQSCIEADSELPPCWLRLSVFFWRVSVRHKTGNRALAVALGERVQQRGPGLLILLWPWRKSTIKQINQLSSHTHTVKPFSSQFPSSVEIILCMVCKPKEMGILMKSLYALEEEGIHKQKLCVLFQCRWISDFCPSY